MSRERACGLPMVGRMSLDLGRSMWSVVERAPRFKTIQ